MKYDQDFRRRRKLVHTLVGTKATIGPYLSLQDVEVHRFLFRVLQEPESFLEHIRTYGEPPALSYIVYRTNT